MKRIFYGWWMAGAGSLMQFVQGTLLLQSFGAYFAVLRDDMGWSKTELSGAAAMHQLEAAVLGPVLGWFLDRFGPQWMIRIGVLVFGAGFMLLSAIESLLSFYGAFILTALGASLCGFFPLNVALIQWFEKSRARALSSMQIGMAAGGLCVPLVAWALAAFGWRATAFASGVLIIVLCLPLSFVFRHRPVTLVLVALGVVVMLAGTGGLSSFGPSAIEVPTLTAATFWTASDRRAKRVQKRALVRCIHRSLRVPLAFSSRASRTRKSSLPA